MQQVSHMFPKVTIHISHCSFPDSRSPGVVAQQPSCGSLAERAQEAQAPRKRKRPHLHSDHAVQDADRELKARRAEKKRAH